MDISYALARIIGVTLIVLALGILVNQKRYPRLFAHLSEQPLLIYFSGFISLVLGLLLLQLHNVWTLDWRVLITLLGWLMVIGGINRILFPDIVLKIAAKLLKKPQKFLNPLYTIFGLLGLYLAYIGFFR